MLERRSALAGMHGSGRRDGTVGEPILRIEEVRGWSLVQAAAFPGTLVELQRAVRLALGATLPDAVGIVTTEGGRHFLRTGERQYWIITPDGRDPTRSLEAAIAAEAGAVTSLSHSRVCIAIEGACAAELLSRGIALDFDPGEFRAGRFALTGLHHTPVLLHRLDVGRFALYASRTFAQSVWCWLGDAASTIEPG